MKTPLNGEKTNSLKPASIAVLKDLRRGPQPRHTINAGSIDRLFREDLIKLADQQVFITGAGLARLEELGGGDARHSLARHHQPAASPQSPAP